MFREVGTCLTCSVETRFESNCSTRGGLECITLSWSRGDEGIFGLVWWSELVCVFVSDRISVFLWLAVRRPWLYSSIYRSGHRNSETITNRHGVREKIVLLCQPREEDGFTFCLRYKKVLQGEAPTQQLFFVSIDVGFVRK